LSGDANDAEIILSRQALHAARLVIAHPETGVRLEFVAPLAADITRVMNELRRFRREIRR
jgi:hypothetical protein